MKNPALNALRHHVTGAIERGEGVAIIEVAHQEKRRRLTAEQRKAVADYEFRLRQEDRYLGSVFVTATGQRKVEADTSAAYERAKALGVGHLC